MTDKAHAPFFQLPQVLKDCVLHGREMGLKELPGRSKRILKQNDADDFVVKRNLEMGLPLLQHSSQNMTSDPSTQATSSMATGPAVRGWEQGSLDSLLGENISSETAPLSSSVTAPHLSGGFIPWDVSSFSPPGTLEGHTPSPSTLSTYTPSPGTLNEHTPSPGTLNTYAPSPGTTYTHTLTSGTQHTSVNEDLSGSAYSPDSGVADCEGSPLDASPSAQHHAPFSGTDHAHILNTFIPHQNMFSLTTQQNPFPLSGTDSNQHLTGLSVRNGCAFGNEHMTSHMTNSPLLFGTRNSSSLHQSAFQSSQHQIPSPHSMPPHQSHSSISYTPQREAPLSNLSNEDAHQLYDDTLATILGEAIQLNSSAGGNATPQGTISVECEVSGRSFNGGDLHSDPPLGNTEVAEILEQFM